MGMLGLVILLFFIGMALFAIFFANPAATDPTLTHGPVLAPPSLAYPLGTDDTGISVLSLVIAGSKTSLAVGLAATVISMTVGALVGIVAGYRAGLSDVALMRITDMFLVLPWLALAIVLAAVLGQSLIVIICIIGFTSWPGTARLVRAQVLSVKEHQFVERGRGLGASDWYVVSRHILPNVMPVILANTILTVAIAILSESALSFLGFGDPFNVTWGTIIEFAFEAGATSIGAWWWLLAPSLCIVLVVLGVHPVRVRVRRDHQPEAPRALMSVLSVRDLRSRTPRRAAPCPPFAACRSISRRARSSGSPGSPGAGSRRSPARSSGSTQPPRRSEGQMLLNGQDVLELTPGKLRAVRWTGASIIFQGALHALNPVRKIGDQIAEAITVHDMAGDKEAYVLAGALLEQVGLPPRRIDDFPHELSGGPEAASDDRDGARVQPRARDRR